jgi:hypothetical protein
MASSSLARMCSIVAYSGTFTCDTDTGVSTAKMRKMKPVR